MDTETQGKPLRVLDVFRRRPWGAQATWPTGAAVLALSLVVLTTLVAMGRTIGLDRWVDGTMPTRGGGPAPLHAFAEAVTTVASPPVTMALLLTVVACWAIWSRTLWPVVAAAPAVLALTATVLLGKWYFARPGPPGSHAVYSLGYYLGYYPSGHTATSLVCTGALAVLVARRHPEYRRWLTWAVTGWTMLVAWSLLWLHFHWLCDVLGAALLGTLLLWLLFRWPWHLVAPPSRRTEGRDVGNWSEGSVEPRPTPPRSR